MVWLAMAAAASYVGFMLVLIIYITVCRTFGWPYNPFAFVLIEYGFIYTLFLGSPWLIRHRGHVYIEMLTAALSARWRKALSRLIVLACAATCIIWTWYTGRLVHEDVVYVAYDELRGQFDIQRWVVTITFPIGFFLMSAEFLRFAFRREPMHVGAAGIAGDWAEIEAQKAAAESGGRRRDP